MCKGALLVNFVVYVLFGDDTLAFMTETSAFVENELLRWALVHSNVAGSPLLSVIN